MNDEHCFTLLHLLHKLLFSFNLLFELGNLGLAQVKIQTFLDELTNVNHLVFNVVLKAVLVLDKLR